MALHSKAMMLKRQGRGRPAGGRARGKTKYDPGEVDRVAAALILQDYIDHQRSRDGG